MSSRCKPDNPCDLITCQNGGTCNNGRCKCPEGYEGEFCEIISRNDIDVEININTTSGNAPLNITVSAVVKSGDVTSFTWDFGDGSAPKQGSSLTYTYTRKGTFIINLTAMGKYNSVKTVSKTVTVNETLPPNASFSFSPLTNIIADKTFVNFTNLSTGTISNYYWTLGANETTSTLTNPSYRFNREGAKSIILIASGPLGQSTKTQTLTVHAMNPTCNNYNDGSSQSETKIRNIRSTGSLRTGKLTFHNDYNNVTAKVQVFHSDEWLNTSYEPFANTVWNFNAGQKSSLGYNSGTLIVGNDWGIRVTFSDGSVSCIRNIQSVSTYSTTEGFVIKSSTVYN